MSDLIIKLDMEHLQSRVTAAIRPALETALSDVNLQKKIVEILSSPPPRSFGMMSLFGERRTGGSMLDDLIDDGVRDLAKQYVRSQLIDMRGEIEEGFRKMMQGSHNRLVKSFTQAAVRALEEDWAFALDVKVSHTVSEKDDDDLNWERLLHP